MNTGNLRRTVLKGFNSATEALFWLGCVALVGIVLLVFADICGRYFLTMPVQGSIELVEQAMAIVGGSAIMYAAVKRGHVAVDVLLARFSRHTQMIMQRIFSLLGFGTWALLAYRVYMDTLEVIKISQTTDVLHISIAPFMLILMLAVFLSSLALLIQTFHPVASEETMGKMGEEGQ